MRKANIDIRSLAKQRRVFLWEIAEGLNIQESRFCKLLRAELPTEEKEKLRTIIEEIAQKKGEC